MLIDHSYIREQISNEDSDCNHIKNDLNMVIIASHKRFDDDGWEQLKNRCYTMAGKSLIHIIEMRKFHRLERIADMI